MAQPAPRGMKHVLLVIAAGVCLVLVVVDFVLAQENHAIQAEVNARQQMINQGIALSRYNEALIRTIALASLRNHDAQLGQVLTAQGITFSLTPTAAASDVNAAQGDASSASSAAAEKPAARDEPQHPRARR